MPKSSPKLEPKKYPRPYSLAKRELASDQARRRCIEAANTLLADSETPYLKMEDVARRAGITRQTIYNLFGSKTELIEAVFDHLARTGGMESMAAAMQQRDPENRLSAMVMTFARFWTASRTTTRHLRTMAATDPDLRAAIHARDERRRMACQHVLRGFSQTLSTTGDQSLQIDLLRTITSFEFFDMLAGEHRTPLSLAPTVLQLARAAIALPQTSTPGPPETQ
jgi:AcrR family transcriptional regulator